MFLNYLSFFSYPFLTLITKMGILFKSVNRTQLLISISSTNFFQGFRHGSCVYEKRICGYVSGTWNVWRFWTHHYFECQKIASTEIMIKSINLPSMHAFFLGLSIGGSSFSMVTLVSSTDVSFSSSVLVCLRCTTFRMSYVYDKMSVPFTTCNISWGLHTSNLVKKWEIERKCLLKKI